MSVPQITVQGPQRKSWRPRKQTRAAFGDVLQFVAGRAYRRLKNRLTVDGLRHFHDAVHWVLVEALGVAASLLSAGQDVRGRDGFATLSRVVEGRVATSHEDIAKRLREARPFVRKAILAAAFAWLRVQFPVLNAASAVAAARLLSDLLADRRHE